MALARLGIKPSQGRAVKPWLMLQLSSTVPPKPVPAPTGAGMGLIVARGSIVKPFRSLPLNYIEQLVLQCIYDKQRRQSLNRGSKSNTAELDMAMAMASSACCVDCDVGSNERMCASL